MRRYSPYNYAFNNPVRFIDPDGMTPFDWYQSHDNSTVKWFDGSGAQEGFKHLGATAQVKSIGEDGGTVNLNANRIAINASIGEQLLFQWYAGPAGYAINAGQVGYGIYQDGGHFGSNAKVATAGALGSMAGAWAGAAVGAKGGAAAGSALGILFFGVGAAPGAAIGGFVGGIGGAFAGGYYGGEFAKKMIR